MFNIFDFVVVKIGIIYKNTTIWLTIILLIIFYFLTCHAPLIYCKYHILLIFGNFIIRFINNGQFPRIPVRKYLLLIRWEKVV